MTRRDHPGMLGTLVKLVVSSIAITVVFVAFAGEFAVGHVNQDVARRLATGKAFRIDAQDQQVLALDHARTKARGEDHRR